MRNLGVEIAGVKLKNPIMTASGTFGSGIEFMDYIDISRLGGITTKGVSNVPWEGNSTPRVIETASGMLNAIGLQNPGIDVFIKRDLEALKEIDTTVMVNVCGHTIDEYVDVVKKLSDIKTVKLLEINISCPNVKAGGITFGTNPDAAFEVTKAIKSYAEQPVIMKLTPNVTNIKEVAKACEEAGADGISLINTLTGMKIDIYNRRFALGNKTGGLSGPAIKPIALRMVYEVAKTVNLPIIGMGGIISGEDALEFMMAGATAISVGTANFNDPQSTIKILEDIEKYMEKYDVKDINDIIGCVEL